MNLSNRIAETDLPIGYAEDRFAQQIYCTDLLYGFTVQQYGSDRLCKETATSF